MAPCDTFETAFRALPLVAILRGVRPEEVEQIGDELADAGFTLIEVPLNSPDPFDSIGRLARRLKGRAIVGAGTVLTPRHVDAVAAAGGRMIVSPNADPAVIAASAASGLVSLPGIFTPTEALAALAAGATALKLFPAEGTSPAMLRAMRTILPGETRLLPVGSIDPGNMASWRSAGASGFGIGSSLYRPGDGRGEVRTKAKGFYAAWTGNIPM